MEGLSQHPPPLAAKDVTFWYPHRVEVKVLRKLNFTIEKGQSAAWPANNRR